MEEDSPQKESKKSSGGGGGGKKGLHSVGEIVYAVDNGNVYEAKVLMVQHEGSLWKYFIHFQGWSRKFDVWVDESSLAKTDDMAAIERLKDSAKLVIVTNKKGKKKGQALGLNDIIPGAIVETPHSGDEDGAGGDGAMMVDGEGGEANGGDYAEETTTVRGGSKRRSSGASSANKKTKVVVDASTLAKQRKMIAASDMFDMDDDGDIDPHARIPIPIGLKKHLVDEWGLITQDPKKLLQLPRPINAQTVVMEYLEQKLKKVEGDQLERYQDLFQGLLLYFDKALPMILLFRYERDQYDQIVSKSQQNGLPAPLPSSIYGAEHLLRLFVRIPRLMSGTSFQASEMQSVQSKLSDFVKYLQKQQARYFNTSDYVIADALSSSTSSTNESPSGKDKKNNYNGGEEDN